MSKWMLFAALACMTMTGVYFYGWRKDANRGDMLMGIGMLLMASSLVVSELDAGNGWAAAWLVSAAAIALFAGAWFAIRHRPKTP